MMLSFTRFLGWGKTLGQRIFRIYFELLKVMLPIIILVKVMEEFGGIDIIGIALGPVMQLVGLPAEMGIVWAATLVGNIYGGMVVFFTLMPSETLSVAQVTVLCTMMLFAHSIPIESSIARKAGIYFRTSLILRIGTAFIASILLNQFYLKTGMLSEPNLALWSPTIESETLSSWAIFQLRTLVQIFFIITALLTLLDVLRRSGIERLFIWMLQPLLRLLGLEKSVSPSP